MRQEEEDPLASICLSLTAQRRAGRLRYDSVLLRDQSAIHRHGMPSDKRCGI